ncbi:hypothetical protein M5W98_29460, partial [Paenibacillus apiarius]|nr:hypothetical protein [Paenibacillus apiarius]
SGPEASKISQIGVPVSVNAVLSATQRATSATPGGISAPDGLRGDRERVGEPLDYRDLRG